MVTAKARFISKLFRERYGVIGVVAGRYVSAGYGVKFNIRSGEVVFDIVALKENEKLAIKVYNGRVVLEIEDVNKIIDAAKNVNAKPVIILYGRGPKVSDELINKLDEIEISIRRIRPK